ncbi:MAG: hypothetical protein JWM47_3215 [Acidimicrobiales bacterium]|nr:hypothetical protein [Acidimicrobiales bacterium]
MTTTTLPTSELSSAVIHRRDHRHATRTTRTDLQALPTVLRSEWIKLSSLRANKVIVALTAVVAGLAAWAVAVLVTDEVLVVSEVFVFPALLTAVFATVAGILLFTSEAQHGTLATALTAQPARWVVALAKVTMTVAVGLVLGAVGMATGAAGAAAGGLELGNTSAMAATTGWALIYTASAAVLGVGIGMIVRHSAGAVSGVLVWWFVIENLLRTFLPAKAVHLLPFDAGYRVLEVGNDFDSPEVIATALTRSQYGLVFGAYAIAAAITGAVLLSRRDAN